MDARILGLDTMTILAKISLIAGIILPFWNIPLVVRVIKRKSSEDISLWWGIGIWTCLLLMLPHGLITEEVVLRGFTIANFTLFTIAYIIILYYRKPKKKMRYSLRLSLFITIFLFTGCTLAYSSSNGGSNWERMVDGIKTYSADKKHKEKFTELCSTEKTATIDGRYDTGGGLYMEMDVPVYANPAKSRMTDLRDKAQVIVIGDVTMVEDVEWIKIKFLYISEYSGAAVGVEDGWIEKKHLRVTS